ncbi:MAG TPA: hypothetical protein VE344_03155 [Methylomirabilota bacterium]|nr:hypothetical protein [Methylomirabilota bacterium]
MSEFKYACPVCGQHISCDSSQAGAQMECPTCFQKITVPQAPSTDGQKFIITGTKKGERPVPTIPEAGSSSVLEKKSSLAVALVLLVLIGMAVAAVFVFRGKIFKSTGTETNQVANASGKEQAIKPATPPKPAIIAPVANDTNWMLNLAVMTNLPDSTAAGRIHGKDFIVERAFLQNGTLTLREGRSGPADFGLQINFGGAQPEALAEKSINVTTNALMAAHVTLRWKDAELDARQGFDGAYAMRLQFGTLANNRMPGKIYFCAPDEMKSYVAGTFNVEIRKPKPKTAGGK